MRVEAVLLTAGLVLGTPQGSGAKTPLIEDLSTGFGMCTEALSIGSVDRIASPATLQMSASGISGAYGVLPQGTATVEAVVTPKQPWDDSGETIARCTAWALTPPHDPAQLQRVSAWASGRLAGLRSFQPARERDVGLGGSWCFGEARKVDVRVTTTSWIGFEFTDAASGCAEGGD